ncbi:MAG TPA: hypothetical protein DCM14_06810 [Clostridiales bacterium UBA8153]|nr:hypothetical protein [Clostridiales bacterium UBA8153]
MPHGRGRILGNEFDGHACLHFAGSLTHGSRRIDPAHRLMVLKAAGRLAEVLWQPGPRALAGDYLVFPVRQDLAAVDLMTSPQLRPQQPELQLVSLVTGEVTAREEDPLMARVEVRANVSRAGGDLLPERTSGLVLRRLTPASPWQVHALTGLQA